VIVRTTYLEQLAVDDLVPAREPTEQAPITRVDDIAPEFSRYLYTAVGGDWHWLGRLSWTLQQWTDWLSRPGSETWVMWVHGAPAGYVELDATAVGADTHAEIAYFGLLPRYMGQGLGGHLLTHGMTQAWSLQDRFSALQPVSRVWVHTCSRRAPSPRQLLGARVPRLQDHRVRRRGARDADRPVAWSPLTVSAAPLPKSVQKDS
jgi:GNAT superfamily N-acetyltransferase